MDGVHQRLLVVPGTPTRSKRQACSSSAKRTRSQQCSATKQLGLLAEVGGGAYAATALSDCLRTGVADSLRDMARIYGADWVWRAYAQLPWSVATGKAAFEAAHGQPLFAFLNEHADASDLFHGAMAAFSGQEV